MAVGLEGEFLTLSVCKGDVCGWGRLNTRAGSGGGLGGLFPHWCLENSDPTYCPLYLSTSGHLLHLSIHAGSLIPSPTRGIRLQSFCLFWLPPSTVLSCSVWL